MKKILLLIAIAIGGLIVGPFLPGNQGLVLVRLGPHQIATSVVSLVLLLLLLYALLQLVGFILRPIFAARGWHSKHQQNKALQQTHDGMLHYLSGEWRLAEKRLRQSAKRSVNAELNYLLAAKASQKLGHGQQAQNYLKLAKACRSEKDLATTLVELDLLIEQQQFEKAREVMKPLLAEYGDNPRLVEQQRIIYQALQEWSSLAALPEPQMAQLPAPQAKISACIASLEEAKNQGHDALLQCWHRFDKTTRRDLELTVHYLTALIELKCPEDAVALLKRRLKSNQNELIPYCANVKSATHYEAMIKLMKQALRHDGRNADAHLALGRLYAQQKQWPEAQASFEQAVSYRGQPQDYRFLALCLEAQGKLDDAGKVARQALHA
ncbi:Protein HemY [Vibrio stylophorae]|uniref:Protein HemY n=1 Tax=Vibrio stylophorae TaxID=659351 RepID=A0ABM8ZXL7_9VIBR|nr:heme biosynthesis HemY N-terminal domain-containing protein [Vibrio stylophorae]CAH0534739.1 Protein HemY [Vibrio stylophorae]